MLSVPNCAFADYFKIVLEVNDNNREVNQSAVLNTEEGSKKNKMQLSIEECYVLHGGENNPS